MAKNKHLNTGDLYKAMGKEYAKNNLSKKNRFYTYSLINGGGLRKNAFESYG